MNWQSQKEKLGHEIIKLLYKNRMILTWCRDNPQGWKLVSGLWSPFYIQLRKLPSHPQILKKVGQALYELIKEEIGNPNLLIGLAMAGIPIATAISLVGNIPSAFTRKVEGNIESFEELIHKYGNHSLVEGDFKEDDHIVLVDDLVSRFTSKLQGIKIVNYEAQKRNISNIKVKDILVLLDREQGAEEESNKIGIKLHSLIPFKTSGIEWLKDDLNLTEYKIINEYLSDPDHFQQKDVQKELIRIANKV